MVLNKQRMTNLDPLIRTKSFKEVALGYSEKEALLEASRCLHCKHKPCVGGCPVNINIPEFIKEISNNNINKAYEIILKDNLFPSICGRVCPQESQCESKCVRAIKGESVGIGRLERYVGDNQSYKEQIEIKDNFIKVAIVGSGPSGLTCAYELRKIGFDVTIFEALHLPGGVLTYGIPEFRLPKSIVNDEAIKLKAMGIHIKTNVVIGKTITIDQLEDLGFKAIYLASGAGLPKFMNIPGENYNGVFSANEFLTRVNLMKAYEEDSDTPLFKAKSVSVIGGGNVAMDAARCAKRLGIENVYIIYRRGKEELPARLEEIEHAEEEGIEFLLLTNPIEIIGDEKFAVSKLKCIKMELGVADASGRRSPKPISNSEFFVETDMIIMALGNYPNPLISKTTKGIDTNKYGCFIVDESMATSRVGIYAGGDATTGAATVIQAMGAGKIAANSISKYLSK